MRAALRFDCDDRHRWRCTVHGCRLRPSAPARTVTLGAATTVQSQRDSWHMSVSETGTEEAKTVQSAHQSNKGSAYSAVVSPVQRKRSDVLRCARITAHVAKESCVYRKWVVEI